MTANSATNKGVIYKITSPRGKMYIGQTVNFENRIKTHKYRPADSSLISLEAQLFGWNSMIVEILFEGDLNKILLHDLERHYIRLFNTFSSEHGLNSQDGGHMGAKYSKESRKKQSDSHLGWKDSEDTKEKKKLNNANCKLVFDELTGIFYHSGSDAERLLNFKRGVLKNRMNGCSPTKTHLRYV